MAKQKTPNKIPTKKRSATPTMRHEPYAELKGLLYQKGITYEAAARAIHMSTTSFSDKINGRSDFFMVELIRLANAFDINPFIILPVRLRNATA